MHLNKISLKILDDDIKRAIRKICKVDENENITYCNDMSAC